MFIVSNLSVGMIAIACFMLIVVGLCFTNPIENKQLSDLKRLRTREIQRLASLLFYFQLQGHPLTRPRRWIKRRWAMVQSQIPEIPALTDKELTSLMQIIAPPKRMQAVMFRSHVLASKAQQPIQLVAV